MSDQPTNNDADREACVVAAIDACLSVSETWNHAIGRTLDYEMAAVIADHILRVLSERGRLRDGTVFDEVNAAIRRTTAFHQETVATLTRERDEARARADAWSATAIKASDAQIAAIARAEKAERDLLVKTADYHAAVSTVNSNAKIGFDWADRALKAEAEAALLRARLKELGHEVR